MKLRNKKTGEIVEDFSYILLESTNYKTYDSIAELNEEWEDVPEEELKVYWYILGSGEINCIEDIGNDFDHAHKKIGNYFESKEEAEKAVEKLKAWKRLKDKGLKVFSYSICGDDFIAECKLTNHTDYGKSMNDFMVMLGFRSEE